LIRIPPKPEGEGAERKTDNTRVITEYRRHKAMLPRIVEADAFIKMFASGDELAPTCRQNGEQTVRNEEDGGV